MIFETHAHYDDEAFDKDREELLFSLEKQGVGTVVNVAASVEGIETTLALTKKYPFVYGAVGVHPDGVGEMNEDVVDRICEISSQRKILAIGEIGLDYYWDKEKHEEQIYWFERQLDIAREKKLPVIIHSREAAEDTLQTAKRKISKKSEA